ncbi:MAG TPA: tetratricopeptide repeat protein [Methylomirabilota bacterium]|jgi:Flp pilus assembly protein TadD|nr:tetratricopeptide repeat protein [Methylomirabilota bacterium]
MPGTELADEARPRPAPAATALGRLTAGILALRYSPLAVALLTFAGFSPALENGFVEWDDYTNLFENQHFRGLRWQHIRWMFTSTLMGHYIPFTWLTFGLDYTLWGMNPLGYHLTNALIHSANAALFCLVALRLLARATDLTGITLRLSAAVTSLFFALHPLRAESVAWATERRDVLSGCFFLVTILAYLRAAESEGHRRRWLLAGSLATYVLALLSKSIVMTLPFVLILLDFFPLGRLGWPPRSWTSAASRTVLREKIPYLALGLAGAATSYWAVASQEYLTSFAKYPWPARIGMAAYSLWFYFEKTVLPIRLSLLYELPLRVDPLAPRFLLSAVAVFLATTAALALARKWPAGLAVWIYYGIVLGPVTGIVHSGHQLTHDRYSYLSCLGFALLVGGSVGAVARWAAAGAVRPWLTRVAAAVVAVWILALSTLTWYQVQVWRDTETLWRYGAESDSDCSICHINLGDALLKQKLFDLAKERYERALQLRPDRTRVYSNLGIIRARTGDPEGAMEYFNRALADEPHDPAILSNIALALINLQRYPEAIGHLRHALRAKPDYASALTNLGVALTETGQPGAALPYLLQSERLRPEEPAVHFDLARVYLALGQTDAARGHYEILSKLDPRVATLLEPALFTVW